MRAPENIKCLGKSLIKHASDLYTERYKKLPRDIKENRKKLGLSRIGNLNIIKISILPKLIQSNPTQKPGRLVFVDIGKVFLKFI